MTSMPLPSPSVSVQPVINSGPRARDAERRVNLPVLCGLALIVGIITSCGAVALRALIGLFHNALYNGTFSIWYDQMSAKGQAGLATG